MQVAGYNHDEEAVLDFRIAYHSGRGPASVPEDSEAPPTPEPIGRVLTLPAHIRYVPSLQASSSCRCRFECGAASLAVSPKTNFRAAGEQRDLL